jgi:hypothetical protein
MASSGSSPSRGASLKASTQTRRRSKEKIRGRAQGAVYRRPGKRERTELQKVVRFIRVVVNGPNDVYVERKRPVGGFWVNPASS